MRITADVLEQFKYHNEFDLKEELNSARRAAHRAVDNADLDSVVRSLVKITAIEIELAQRMWRMTTPLEYKAMAPAQDMHLLEAPTVQNIPEVITETYDHAQL